VCKYELTIAISFGVLMAVIIRWVIVPRLICAGVFPKEKDMTFKEEIPIILVLSTAFLLTIESAIWLLGLYCN